MDVKALLTAAWFCPMGAKLYEGAPVMAWGLTLKFEGEPGTAKSRMTSQQAAACGLPMEMLSPGMRGEGAFGCVPVPKAIKMAEREVMVLDYPAPAWAYKFKEAGRGLLFLDEINTAPPALQPYLLGLTLDGIIGAEQLPPGVRRVAQMNSTEDAAGGWDLAPAQANRLCHLAWEAPSAKAWTDWLLGGDEDGADRIDPGKEEARVLKAWPLPWSRACGLVAGFISRRPELLHREPKVGDPQRSKAWPSRRTWEFATRALAISEVYGLDDVTREELVAGFVGTAAAAELAQYERESNLPDPEELLDGKASWKHDTRRLDITMAVLGACAALVKNKDAPKRNARAAALWVLMAPVCKEDADVVVPAGRVLCKSKLSAMPEAKFVLAKIQPMLKAAGINASDS